MCALRSAPFYREGSNQLNSLMGLQYHLVPNIHALFFGPIECMRHTFPDLLDDEEASVLIVDDVNTSLGRTEDLIREAVAEIVEMYPKTEAFLFCTACQTAFLGIDLDSMCQSLHEATGLFFAHFEANRMASENIPGKDRKTVPGGDRYHTRRAVFRVFEQLPAFDPADGDGVLVLTDDALDADCDLKDLIGTNGIEWVRGVGDCTGFSDFLTLARARVVIANSMPWKEVGDYLHERFGIPFLYLPTSYSLDEIEGYYATLDELLPPTPEILSRRAERRARAQADIESTLAAARSASLDLDLRVMWRPFSAYEALSGYGFDIRTILPNKSQIQHKEEDDAPAFERLLAAKPEEFSRFKPQPNSRKRKGPASPHALNRRRPGRFVDQGRLERATERVPEETAWWGYSSISALMSELSRDFGRATQITDKPVPSRRWHL